MSEVEAAQTVGAKVTMTGDLSVEREAREVNLDTFVRLDEPEQLMWELAKLAEDLSARNPRSEGWRYIAKWAKECNEELAKLQEPPSR